MNKYVVALVASLAAGSAFAGDVYVAGNLGTQVEGSREASLGLALGTDLTKNLRVEGAYEHRLDSKSNNLYAHVMPQATIPSTGITPYALVGLGVDLESLDGKPLYVLGAGVRTELTKTIDLDLRYRRIDTVDNNDRRESVTAGLALKF
jgi:opacity protein-like surface antigen